MKTAIIQKLRRHKLLTIFIIIIVVIGGNIAYGKLKGEENTSKSVLAAVETGTIIVSVSGTGQIYSLDEANIKSEEDLEDAEIAYELAKNDLDELLNPDEDTIKNFNDDLKEAIKNEEKAKEDIADGYEDAFSTLSNIFMNLSSAITEAEEIIYGYNIASSESTFENTMNNESVYLNIFDPQDRGDVISYIDRVKEDYDVAREQYDETLFNYRLLTISSSQEEIKDLLDESLIMTKSLVQTIKDEINLMDFVVDYLSTNDRRVYSGLSSYQSSLRTYLTSANSLSSSVSSVKDTIENNEEDLEDAKEALEDAQEALDDILAGPDDLELRSQESVVRQKEKALTNAENNLANCNIYAPFAGTVSVVNVEKGDSVSSGTSLATIITNQKIASITLNEIDAASVRVGQKATISFDALDDITISGEVIDVDEVGTASSGVVNYGIKISLDVDLDTVKPGMSVTADIITDVKQNVLTIPSSAIKTQNGSSYVELVSSDKDKELFANDNLGVVLSDSTIKQTVETGLSNDTLTEVISGLNEGDLVVSSTINQSLTSVSTNPTNSGISIPGVTGSGMQMMR